LITSLISCFADVKIS